MRMIKDFFLTLFKGVLVGLGVAVGYGLWLRPKIATWGTRPEERAASYPGDDLLPQGAGQSLRAITIQAPIEQVWAWVVQIGQGRGGFYSYDWLENLAGLDIHSAERIVPEWQDLKVGDPISLGGPALEAIVVEKPRLLLFRSLDPETGMVVNYRDPELTSYWDTTWGFILREVDPQTTRLLIRSQMAASSVQVNLLGLVLEVITFIMEEKMLRGIKDRAEKRMP